MLIMLRFAARVRSWEAALAASIAVSAIAASAMMLIHPLDASILIVIFNVGTAALITGTGVLSHRRVFALVEPL
jgi:hypothetical protein